MSLSLLKPPKFVLSDDLWPVHPHTAPGLGMSRTQIPSAGLKTLWDSFYWCQPFLAVSSLPYKTRSSSSVLPCTPSDASAAPFKPFQLPSLTPAARSHQGCFSLPIPKTTKGLQCSALPKPGHTALFPGPVLDAGPAVGAAAQGCQAARRAVQAGVAPHG